MQLRQTVQRALVIEELANEGGDTAAAFRLFFDGSRLLGRESKGLREVIVSRRGVLYQDIADRNRFRTSLTGWSVAQLAGCPGKSSES